MGNSLLTARGKENQPIIFKSQRRVGQPHLLLLNVAQLAYHIIFMATSGGKGTD